MIMRYVIHYGIVSSLIVCRISCSLFCIPHGPTLSDYLIIGLKAVAAHSIDGNFNKKQEFRTFSILGDEPHIEQQ